MKGKYIVVEGNIGAGKTSLTQMLHADYGGKAIYEEFAENRYLAKFYEDPEKFAFPLELSFLTARFNQLDTAFIADPAGFFIADYHFEKSLHFATVNLSDSEIMIYESLFSILNGRLRQPDLIIFLRKSISNLQANIAKRGRPFEKGIGKEYLQKINSAYELMLSNTGEQRRLEIDTDHLDFVNNRDDYNLIIRTIEAKLSAIKC